MTDPTHPAPAAPEFKCGTCKDTGSILGTRRVFNAVTEKAIDVCAGWERCPECEKREIDAAIQEAAHDVRESRGENVPPATPRETPREAGRVRRETVRDRVSVGKWSESKTGEPVAPAAVEAPDVEGLPSSVVREAIAAYGHEAYRQGRACDGGANKYWEPLLEAIRREAEAVYEKCARECESQARFVGREEYADMMLRCARAIRSLARGARK